MLSPMTFDIEVNNYRHFKFLLNLTMGPTRRLMFVYRRIRFYLQCFFNFYRYVQLCFAFVCAYVQVRVRGTRVYYGKGGAVAPATAPPSLVSWRSKEQHHVHWISPVQSVQAIQRVREKHGTARHRPGSSKEAAPYAAASITAEGTVGKFRAQTGAINLKGQLTHTFLQEPHSQRTARSTTAL